MRVAVFGILLALFAGVAFAQEPVKLGVHLELSGRMTVPGNDTLFGMEVARGIQPEVLGRQVEFSICDNASTVEGAVACANRFADEGVVAVLGNYASSHAIPAANVLQDAGIVMVATGATNPAVTQIGDFIFRVPYTDEFEGSVAGQYAYNDMGARKAAIFRQQDDDYSFGLAGFFRDRFEADGGETLMLDYTANTVDFSAQLSDMRSFAPDVVYLSGFCAEYASLVPQLRQQGFDAPLLGGAGTDDSQCPDGGGAAFDGMEFLSFGEPEVLSGAAAERAREFHAEFSKQHGDEHFTGFTLSGADAYRVVWQAIESAGEAEAAAVRDALMEMEDFPGVSGDITYVGTDGTPANRVVGRYGYVFADDGSWEKTTLGGVSLE